MTIFNKTLGQLRIFQTKLIVSVVKMTKKCYFWYFLKIKIYRFLSQKIKTKKFQNAKKLKFWIFKMSRQRLGENEPSQSELFYFSKYDKVWCVSSMVIWSQFRMRHYWDDNDREDAPHFTNLSLQYGHKSKRPAIMTNLTVYFHLNDRPVFQIYPTTNFHLVWTVNSL